MRPKATENNNLTVNISRRRLSQPDLGGDFIRGNFAVALPIPDIHCHVVLRAHRNDVLQIGRECLQIIEPMR